MTNGDHDSGNSFGPAISDMVRHPKPSDILQSVADADVLGAKKASSTITNLSNYDFQPVDHDPFQGEQPSMPTAGRKATASNMGYDDKFSVGGIVAPAVEAIDDIAASGIPQSIASDVGDFAQDQWGRIKQYNQNQWDRIKEDNFNPFSTKSNDLRNWQQQRAHGGRVEPLNINHAPTEAQKSAGNYAKDHLSFQGLPITVENAKGSMRHGVGPGGKSWECVIPAHYGYIKGTEGRDGDHVDVYIGPHGKSPHVFVVDQVNHETKRFDEVKVMLGFGSKAQAITTYKRAFSDGKGHARIGKVHGITMAQFKDWLSRGDTMKRFVVSKSEPDIKLPEGYTVEYAEGFGWSLYDPHGVMLGTGEERNDAARHLKNQKVIVLQPLKARAA